MKKLLSLLLLVGCAHLPARPESGSGGPDLGYAWRSAAFDVVLAQPFTPAMQGVANTFGSGTAIAGCTFTTNGNIVCAGTVDSVTTKLSGNFAMSTGNGASGSTDVRGNTSNVANNDAFAIGNTSSLTAGMDRYIVRAFNDLFSTEKARLATNGTWTNAADVGTAASGTGVTASYSGAGPYWLHKVVVTNTAMTAAGTTDISVVVATPANSAIRRIKVDVTTKFSGGALTAVTLTCGNTAGGNQYLLSGDIFTNPIVLGDAAGEVGAGLLTATWADFGTASAGTTGAINVTCRFTCTTANCNAATAGTANFYVEGVTYY